MKRKNKVILATVAVLLGAGLIGTGGYFMFRKDKTNPPAQEQPSPDEPGTPDTPGPESPLTYEVTIKIGNETTTQTVATGGLVTFPEEQTKEGFNFLGYAVEGSEELIDPETFTVTENVTLVAVFEEIQCNVVFEMDEYTNNQIVSYGEVATPPTEVFEKEGFTFEGWAVKGTSEVIDFATYQITQDTIFEAVYKAITYQVTFVIEGENQTQTVGYNQSAVKPEIPEREGYEALGFAIQGTTTVVDVDTLIIVEDTVFEAQYKRITTSVSQFTISNNQITKYNGSSASVVVPMSYSLDDSGKIIEGDDIVIDTIAYGAFQYKSTLTSVKILSNIKTIKGSVFNECQNLTSVSLSEGLETIEAFAFHYCTKLTDIEIPSTVKTIGSKAFSTLYELANITFKGTTAPTVTSDAFENGAIEVVCYVPKESLSEYKNVFAESNLKGHIWEIGAYKEVSNFKILINSTDNTCAIYGHISGTSVTIPDSITVDDNAYTPTSIYAQAFFAKKISYLKMPNTITEIGGSAFFNCSSLVTVVMSTNVEKIDSYAFRACSKLANITLPSTLKEIGECAFVNCIKVTSFNLPEGLTTIGACAFQNSTGFTEITIPSTVTNIGADAFSGCTGLTITFTSDPVGVEVSGLSTVKAIYVPASCYETLINGDWSEFASIVHSKDEA